MEPKSIVYTDLAKAQKVVPDITLYRDDLPIRESLLRCKPCGRVSYEIYGSDGLLWSPSFNAALSASSKIMPDVRSTKPRSATQLALL